MQTSRDLSAIRMIFYLTKKQGSGLGGLHKRQTSARFELEGEVTRCYAESAG